MSKKLLFSIITVTCNNIAGLKRTAKSIEIQEFQDYEWIVIDGASNDGSSEWLKLSKANWTSEEDDGIYHAMNKGMKRGSGQYLLFLNAGDILAGKNVLEHLAQEIANEPIEPDFVYGDSLESNKNNKPIRKPARSHEQVVSGMFTHHQAMLYKREALANLRYSPLYDIAADYDFTMRFLKQAKNILYCKYPVCVFEPGGVSQRKALQGRAEQFQIRKNLGTKDSVNAAVFVAQTIAWNFRKIFPSLYWKAKSGKKSSGSKSND
ncbi:MAG: glycosyl transferase [Micavibrio sp.]|nr:MAG: glycosyl transferase [Micavibrio sp.]